MMELIWARKRQYNAIPKRKHFFWRTSRTLAFWKFLQLMLLRLCFESLLWLFQVLFYLCYLVWYLLQRKTATTAIAMMLATQKIFSKMEPPGIWGQPWRLVLLQKSENDEIGCGPICWGIRGCQFSRLDIRAYLWHVRWSFAIFAMLTIKDELRDKLKFTPTYWK